MTAIATLFRHGVTFRYGPMDNATEKDRRDMVDTLTRFAVMFGYRLPVDLADEPLPQAARPGLCCCRGTRCPIDAPVSILIYSWN
jgi:hypothetical protein